MRGLPVTILALVVALPARAQAPDCTGISGVFNTSPDFVGELTAHRIASGLANPILVASATGDNTRLFIVLQSGVIRVVKHGAMLETPFLDIEADVASGGEEGLLGLAFHPDYPSNGWFFVYHTNPAGDNVVARYTVSADPDVADPDSRADVIAFAHPTWSNHNGGMIAFSPLDGHLYIGTGDGGGGCDPGPGVGNAQSRDSNLGKLLRLNVDSLPATTAGNPYDGLVPGNDEIWSVGLRNPWRWTFDRVTGAIYIGDVGQEQWEEINCHPPAAAGGQNYGWPLYEGSHCPNPSCGAQGSCLLGSYVAPIREYDHTLGCVAVSGYVYRGCRMPALRGTYFYSDACTGFISSFRTDASCFAGPDIGREVDVQPGVGGWVQQTVAFGEDQRGETYFVDLLDGEVFKLLPELSIMEVSGPGASPLLFQASGDLGWEDLEPDTSFVASYKVYRSTAGPTGPFDCVALVRSTTWVGGDAQVPTAGQVFYYLTTGLTVSGIESTAGARSDGQLRSVNTASACS